MNHILSVVLLFFSLLFHANCARILCVFPCPSFSHQVVFRPIVNELANRGHELVVLTTDPQQNSSLKNVKEINLSGAYNYWDVHSLATKENKYNVIKELKDIFAMMDTVLDYELTLPEVKDLLNSNEHFDLLFVEFLFPTMLGFSVKFDCPSVGIVSMDAPTFVHEMLGNPTNPVVYPDFQLPFVPPLTFFERVISTIFRFLMEIYGDLILAPQEAQKLVKYFGPNMPSMINIVQNISMVFLNTNPILQPIRPLGPSTIQIGGGTQITPIKELPKDINDYLDNAKNGVVYVSFGTNVKSNSISPEFLQILLDTFKDLPYQILWKFDVDIPDKSDNIKIIKWGPQQDILRHPNIKLFVMQGGLQSTEESIFSHVPIVCIPFFGDQEANANTIVNKGIGLRIEKKTDDKIVLTNTIKEVIGNAKYQNRVKEIAELLGDQQATGVEKAVWWIEYVIRHKGATHFRNSAAEMPIYQYLLLDVLLFLALIVFVPLYLIYRSFKWLIIKLVGSRKSKVKTQ